jgi:GT2 family glycosyltransferase
LVTYVNFPTTEYLQLPFLDFQCFNVYLENREVLANYLARLQNLVDEKPLVMAEIGLDSQRNGEDVQAESLDWQMRTAFAEGCAGTFIFAWTDEWYRGGHDIEDWDFGLTTRDREPKPALEAVTSAYAELPFPPQDDWPKVSVVVCSYNGASTIRDTMEGLKHLAYLNFEVIVVNDGSTDATPDIAAEYDVKLISTENRGLSAARNTGWQEASGEIIAYIDDDAYPDPHWLHYIVHTYQTTDFVGVGGPNIAPPGDGPIADCVANSPGGPVQVLISDIEAEHIPGCNMSFRREALAAVDGFDARYRAAGDDVDLCWRLQEAGGKIGFHAAAMDWHHRRNSVMMYWKQQQGYGKAEALLEEKWPEKYNALGHFSWSGRLYGKGMTESIPTRRNRVYQGQWGLALFQSIYEPAAGFITSLPLMPEWFLLIGVLAIISLLGLSWSPLLWATPILIIAIAAPIAQAILSAAKADFPSPHPSATERLGLRALTALLHLIQPVARLKGRLEHGLTLWRQRTSASPNWNVLESQTLWREDWRTPDAWLGEITALARQQHKVVREGGDFDDWDIELCGGLGDARLIMAVEEHGAGKEMLRFRCWCRLPTIMIVTLIAGSILSALAAMQDAWVAAGIISLGVLATAWLSLRQATQGMAVIAEVLKQYGEEQTREQSDPDTSAGDEYPEPAATK